MRGVKLVISDSHSGLKAAIAKIFHATRQRCRVHFKVFSETDFHEDLKLIDVPVFVMHGEDDQIAPFLATGARSVKLLRYGTLKSYPGFPHGMPTTNADQINAALLAFIEADSLTRTASRNDEKDVLSAAR